MNVLVVYAHHEPSSFTAAMKNRASEILSHQGHSVIITDLYGLGFSPVAQKWDFVTTAGGHFNYMLEQAHAARLDLAFSPDIIAEIQKLKTADLVIFIAPLWWGTVPAILKGWFDRVMAMGVAWDSGKIFETGLLRGKQAMLAMTAGGPTDFFGPTGLYKATPTQLLHHINQGLLAFCGMDVHEPFVALNILGEDNQAREKQLADLQYRMENIQKSPNWLVNYPPVG